LRVPGLGNPVGVALNYSWVGHPTHLHATAGNEAVRGARQGVQPPRSTASTERFSHYSRLRTTQDLLGVRPLLAGAQTATSMRGAFGL
jgi:hypothetical protein